MAASHSSFTSADLERLEACRREFAVWLGVPSARVNPHSVTCRIRDLKRECEADARFIELERWVSQLRHELAEAYAKIAKMEGR